MCHVQNASSCSKVQELMHQDLDVWIDGRHRVRSHEPISEEGGHPPVVTTGNKKGWDGYKRLGAIIFDHI